MRDAIASSYDDLAAEQQRLFRALCVFSGGFTLTMAKSVAADPGPDGQSAGATAELDERLLQLVDDSLVASGPVESEPRFSILETIREFGVDELAAQSELDHVSARHTAFFLDFAEAALARLSGAGRTTWLDRLDRDQANLRTALTWLCESGETAQAVQLAGALWQFWWWRSHLEEGLTWLERVAALPGADQTGSAYARLLTGLGSFAETSGDLAAAERFHDEAARAWQAINDPRGLAMSLLFRWLVAFSNDDEARMNALSSESARLFEQAGDRWGIAMSLMEQGVMAMRKSRNEQGEHLLTNAISTFASIEDAWGVAICRGALGNIRTDQKRYDDAESVLKESLSALVQLNDLWGLATIFPAAVRLAAEQGRFEAVAHAAGALESMHHRLGAPLRVPFRHAYGANLTRAQATLGKARFDTLLAEGAEMSPATAVTAAFAATARGKGSASDQPAPLAALAFPLSAREREVLRLMPFKSAAEIAHELFIAESTVRTHFNNIYSKLGVANQKEAIAYIYQHRLI
jgi:DNA-binding CsgD family transcriptional regulator